MITVTAFLIPGSYFVILSPKSIHKKFIYLEGIFGCIIRTDIFSYISNLCCTMQLCQSFFKCFIINKKTRGYLDSTAPMFVGTSSFRLLSVLATATHLRQQYKSKTTNIIANSTRLNRDCCIIYILLAS